MSIKMTVHIEGETTSERDIMVDFMSTSLSDLLSSSDKIEIKSISIESPHNQFNQSLVLEIEVGQ